MSKAEQEIRAVAVVRDYLLKCNRPYSANDILQNLHKEFGKAIVQRALDALVQQRCLIEKPVSKQKIYYPNQDQFEATGDAAAQTAELDAAIAQRTAEVTQLKGEVQQLEARCKALSAMESAAKLQETIAAVTAHNERQRTRIAVAEREEQPVISKQDMDAARRALEKSRQQARKRKSMCKDVLNAILEGYPKSRRTLYEEVGIDDDESEK